MERCWTEVALDACIVPAVGNVYRIVVHSCAKRSSLFVFALNYSKPKAACTIEEGSISDSSRGFIFAHESGWQFKMDPHLSPLQKPERQRASRKGTSKGYG
jgi:hypothetical protein